MLGNGGGPSFCIHSLSGIKLYYIPIYFDYSILGYFHLFHWPVAGKMSAK